jgi:hypothetical protein
MARFPIRFTGASELMGLVGMPRSRCYVDVDDTRVHVRMGMWFELDTERTIVRSAAPDHDRVLAWGVHGWGGRWLVNGSSSGIVRLTLDPSARAWMGPVPLRVSVLRVSVEDPDGLVTALSLPGAAMPSRAPRPAGDAAPGDDRGTDAG